MIEVLFVVCRNVRKSVRSFISARVNSIITCETSFRHCRRDLIRTIRHYFECYDCRTTRAARVAALYGGALALVCADVLVEDGLLPEVFPALRALIGLLTRVDAQMLVEDGPLAEGPLAVDTGVGLLVGVDAKVLG